MTNPLILRVLPLHDAEFRPGHATLSKMRTAQIAVHDSASHELLHLVAKPLRLEVLLPGQETTISASPIDFRQSEPGLGLGKPLSCLVDLFDLVVGGGKD